MTAATLVKNSRPVQQVANPTVSVGNRGNIKMPNDHCAFNRPALDFAIGMQAEH
jgi:hypothetical protein